MDNTKKLTLEEALAADAIAQHNSAIGNVVCVVTAIQETRKGLQRELAQCDVDEAWARELSTKTEEDPIAVNDSDKLHTLMTQYRNNRGGRFRQP